MYYYSTSLSRLLYTGYGTHFSYVFVGTPPQRQTVIVDTGSHYTGFPCTGTHIHLDTIYLIPHIPYLYIRAGCSQCGNHVNPYWDIKNSTTATIPKCGGTNQCSISQSYSEGSSWKGYLVQDKFYVGASNTIINTNTHSVTPSNTPATANTLLSVDFQFACQTYETGLFRTQLADGIMGMSISEDTLPAQLMKQKVTNTRIFALCYRVGGGIMTLGGVRIRYPYISTRI